jgi:hypothetical protein
LLKHDLLLSVMALAAAVLSGCSGIVTASSGSHPGSQAAIQVTPSSVNFGSIVAGKKISQVVSVANTGNISVNISQVNVSSSQFSVSGLTMPFSLPVGQSSNFQVWFDATAAGNFTGTLTLRTDTGVASEQVALAGTSTTAPQQIRVTPASLNLGSATVGTTVKGTVTVSNVGGSDLTISSISVPGNPFTVSGLMTPSTIAPGASNSFNVTYSPTAPVTSSGSVRITSDDPQTPISFVSLSGTGTATTVPPTITTQPANQTVTSGQTAMFTVVAAGTAPLSYQWEKNGVNIAGATLSSYTTAVTTTSGSGSTFSVAVANTAGTVTSASATLTVDPAPVSPTITTQPVSQTVTAGQTATFTVVATGTAPLNYQWKKNGANILGATAASYITPASTTSDSGSTFAVVVTNTAGTVTSSAATLTVNPTPVSPTITTQPLSQTLTAGQTATFAVVATGTAPLSYQWQKNGVNIAGATLNGYITPATTTSDSGSTFAVVVTNTAGTVTSSAATLTVNPAPVSPTITTQPVSQTVTAGQTATFTVVAAGTAPLSYQWQKRGVAIVGATSSSYTTVATTTSDSGSTFSVVVTNTAGTVTSSGATFTVNPAPVAPTITTQPASQTVTAGQTATFAVVAAGTAPLSYQWQKNGVNIAGATLSSYTTPTTTTSDSGSAFSAVVTNTAGTVTSAAATLTVNPAPAPAIQLNPTAINFGNAVVGVNLSQVLIIKNTGTATLTISQVTATGSGFSVSGFSLPLNVSVGQQTTITVAFLPTVVGSASGNISIVSNAPTSPSSVSLSGNGIAATFILSISPTSLSFGNVTTGTSSAAQSVIITNTGNSNVVISQITVSGAGYTLTGGSAPVTLTPLQIVSLSVQFGPRVAGTVSGNVSIVSNATGSPATVPLTGTGVSPVQHSVALAWNASTSTVAGYNVYRGTVSGGAYAKINSSLVAALDYTDSTVQSGTTYYYVTKAVDSGGNESVFSNEVSAAIP